MAERFRCGNVSEVLCYLRYGVMECQTLHALLWDVPLQQLIGKGVGWGRVKGRKGEDAKGQLCPEN